jgi:hypothetical protein
MNDSSDEKEAASGKCRLVVSLTFSCLRTLDVAAFTLS